MNQNFAATILGGTGQVGGAADPSNAGWQRDLSYSLTAMAQLCEQQGDRTEALHFAQESLRIDERLAGLDRSNATWQRDVAISRALVVRLLGQGAS